MEDKKKRTSNRGLVVILCVLTVLIVGLGIGIMVVTNNNNKYEDQQSMGGDDLDEGEGVEEIIAEYQEKIDAADSDEKKAELYMRRADLLGGFVSDDDNSYCGQILDDLENRVRLMGEKDVDVIDEMPSACVISGEIQMVVTEGIVNE